MWFTLTSILCFSGAYILSDSFKNIINSSITNIISYGLDVYVYITIKIKPYTFGVAAMHLGVKPKS